MRGLAANGASALLAVVAMSSMGCDMHAEERARCANTDTSVRASLAGGPLTDVAPLEQFSASGDRIFPWAEVAARAEIRGEPGSDRAARETAHREVALKAIALRDAHRAVMEALSALTDASRAASAALGGPVSDETAAENLAAEAALDAVGEKATALAAALAARQTAADEFVRVAGPIVQAEYERAKEIYEFVIEGLARNPEAGSPLMNAMSARLSFLQISRSLTEHFEQLLLLATDEDWSERPAITSDPATRTPSYGRYGAPPRIDIDAAAARKAEVEWRIRRIDELSEAGASAVPTTWGPRLTSLSESAAAYRAACHGVPAP